jgi:signal peptidase I
MTEDMQEFAGDAPDVGLHELAVFDSSSELGGTDTGEPETQGGKSQLREWCESLAFTVVFVLVFTSYVAQATRVPTESMKPTIMVGDHFFLDKLGFQANYPAGIRGYLPDRSLSRGDIVAFSSPTLGDIPFVKRLIGLPGDVIEISDKELFVNDVRLDEPYKIHVDESVYRPDPWTPSELHARDSYGPVTLPENSYFVMGDNRDNSNDSRFWGFVRKEEIIGKPLFIYWSYRSDPYVPGQRSFKESVRGYWSIATHFFSRTRWFRIGKMID